MNQYLDTLGLRALDCSRLVFLVGFAQKVFRPRKKERGQARLPNFELIRLELLIGAGEAFNVKAFTRQRVSRSGRRACPRSLVAD